MKKETYEWIIDMLTHQVDEKEKLIDHMARTLSVYEKTLNALCDKYPDDEELNEVRADVKWLAN